MKIPETLYLEDNALVILDQTLLPNKTEYVRLTTLEETWKAIKTLQVRGAPAIGIAAAMGLYVHMKYFVANGHATEIEAFTAEFNRACEYLSTSRPTAVNLNWGLEQMTETLKANKEEGKSVSEIIEKLEQTAKKINDDDTEVCRLIGEFGLTLLKPKMGILTHCNAGSLATSKYGTALAPIYLAEERGFELRVFADETRPLLQGARLTAFELLAAGVDTTLICDNMAATVMANGWIDVVFVGCDRVAANGDFANKIGTLGVAILAKHFNIPFYVCAPFSTIDLNTKTGADIIIEERDGDEITTQWYEHRQAPQGIKTFNPSFDVTLENFVSGYITENGILKPPFLAK